MARSLRRGCDGAPSRACHASATASAKRHRSCAYRSPCSRALRSSPPPGGASCSSRRRSDFPAPGRQPGDRPDVHRARPLRSRPAARLRPRPAAVLPARRGGRPPPARRRRTPTASAIAPDGPSCRCRSPAPSDAPRYRAKCRGTTSPPPAPRRTRSTSWRGGEAPPAGRTQRGDHPGVGETVSGSLRDAPAFALALSGCASGDDDRGPPRS